MRCGTGEKTQEIESSTYSHGQDKEFAEKSAEICTVAVKNRSGRTLSHISLGPESSVQDLLDEFQKARVGHKFSLFTKDHRALDPRLTLKAAGVCDIAEVVAVNATASVFVNEQSGRLLMQTRIRRDAPLQDLHKLLQQTYPGHGFSDFESSHQATLESLGLGDGAEFFVSLWSHPIQLTVRGISGDILHETKLGKKSLVGDLVVEMQRRHHKNFVLLLRGEVLQPTTMLGDLALSANDELAAVAMASDGQN
mmetsp:Transcript_389/g.568  ORF Transcript_389/g.568 Transcript_389/m.568 type:complete len:252 (+) Transcript_389:98-853(+)